MSETKYFILSQPRFGWHWESGCRICDQENEIKIYFEGESEKKFVGDGFGNN